MLQEPTNATEFGRLHELMYELKVEQVMTRQVVTVKPSDSMRSVKELLNACHYSGAPVVEGGQVVGIVSVRDVMRALEMQTMDRPVSECMTRDAVTVLGHEVVAEAVKKFARHGFGRLPVLDSDGALVGVVTPSDISGRLLLALERRSLEEESKNRPSGFPLGELDSDDTHLLLRYYVKAHDIDAAGEASTRLKRTLASFGLDPRVVRRACIAAYEAEMNLAIHSVGGWLTVELTPQRVAIKATDGGPGIADIEQALQPGFSTAPDWVRELGFGAGMGLNNIQRCSDQFQIDSEVGRGTVVWATVSLEAVG